MSSFLATEDNITFGIQGSNEVEVAQISSTLDDVRVRLYTNNDGSLIDNLKTGTVFGSSNYDKTATASNNFYIGHLTAYSNVTRVVTIQGPMMGINTTPESTLHVLGDGVGEDLVRVNAGAHNAFIMNAAGNVGFGTTPVAGNTVTVKGRLQVDAFTITATNPGTDDALLVAEGLKAPSGIDYLRFADNSLCNITNILLKNTLIADQTIVASNVLQATNLQPVTGSVMQFTTASLSNINNIFTNNGSSLVVDHLRGSTDPTLVQFTAATLSNITAVKAVTLETTYLDTVAPGDFINVLNNSLSNISILSKVGTVDATKLTTTEAAGGLIDVDQKSLSNIALLSKVTTLDLSRLVNTMNNSTIDVTNQTLSNITTLSKVGTVDATKLTTTVATGGLIDVDQKSLSNIALLSKVTTLDISRVVNTMNNSTVDFTNQTLSNITTLSKVGTIDVTKLTTTEAAGSLIDVDQKSLSNIALLSKVTTLDISKIVNTMDGGIIDVTRQSLSNIDAVKTTLVETSFLNTLEPQGLINVMNNSLSNITNLSKVGTIDVTKLTTTATSGVINVDQKSLSNIHATKTDILQVATLMGAPTTNIIVGDTAPTLSNMGHIHVATGRTLFTDFIASESGNSVNFSGHDVYNIRNLRVNSNITVNGQFFVIETTTCNTSQFVIENDGTGPAFIVNQTGFEHIAQFMDDSNVVMFIKNGGQTAFGSFGNSFYDDLPIPNGLVYIENPSSSNQAALYIDQHNAGEYRLALMGPSHNIVFTGSGQMGINTAPNARIDIAQDATETGDFLRFSSNGDPTIRISADGNVGIGSVAADSRHRLFVEGTVQAKNLYLSSTLTGNDRLVHAYGMTASDNLGWLDFGNNHMSNMDVLTAGRILSHRDGSAATPAYSFELDPNTGLYRSAADSLSITTAGVERLRVQSDGNIGIGTTYAPVRLAVYSTDAILVPKGTNAQRPPGVQGYIRFNVDTQSFEGFGAGDAWGTLGGVKDVNLDTYISAETAPGDNNDELRFYNSNIETMRIQKDGNVGIGTTQPREKLDVRGNFKIGDAGNSSNYIVFAGVQGDSDIAGAVIAENTYGTVDQTELFLGKFNDGNGPDRIRHVAAQHVFEVYNSTLSGTTVEDRLLGSYTHAVSIIQDGNVGIGSTGPNTKLDVAGTVRAPTMEMDVLSSTRAYIDTNQKTLSNLNILKTTTAEVYRLTGSEASSRLIDANQSTLSNLLYTKTTNMEVSKITTLAPAGLIDIDQKSLSNIDLILNSTLVNTTVDTTTVYTDYLTTRNSLNYINLSTKSLSNITKIAMGTLAVDQITAQNTVGVINTNNTTLSNITKLSKVNTLDVTRIEDTVNGGVINVSYQTLSNLLYAKTENLELGKVTTLRAAGLIDFSDNSLSNIDVLSKVNTIDVGKITTTETANVIDVDQKTLSNLDIVKTRTTETTNLTTLAPAGLINVLNNSLSNITYISKVGTIDVTKLTTTTSQNVIDVDQKTLSNLDIVKTTTAEMSYLTTLAAGGIINVSTKSLSNITMLQAVNISSTDVAMETLRGNNVENLINVKQATLSNIATAKVDTVEVSTLTTLASGGLINMIGNSLSNISTLSKVGTLDVRKITTTDPSTVMDVDQMSLSNLNWVKGTNMEVTNLTTLAAGGLINVSNKTLSNVNTLEVDNITNTAGMIDMTQMTLSNIAALSKVTELDVTRLVNTMNTNTIDVTNLTLSNISLLSKVNTLDISKIVNTTSSGMIDVTQQSLSNILDTMTTNLQVTNLRGSPANNQINMSGSTLSNLSHVYMNTGATMYTNSIQSTSGDMIGFNNKDVNNIRNLTVNENIIVRGQFFVMETTTCNTTQMVINNEGTGPALIVNQRGAEHITQFMDDSNVVMFIKDGGQTAFGSFGNSFVDDLPQIPDTLVYMHNPIDSNQDALVVQQDRSGSYLLRLVGTDSNVVVTATGKIGVGVANPSSRIEVANIDASGFLKYSSPTQTNAFVVANDGHLGIGQAPSATHMLTTPGMVQAGQVVTGDFYSSNALFQFNNQTLSNIANLYVGNFAVNQQAATSMSVEQLYHPTGGAINIMQSSLSNIDVVKTDTMEVDTITSLTGIINTTHETLSNMAQIMVERAVLTTLTSSNATIDVDSRTLSNITEVQALSIVTPDITGTGTNKEVSFNFSRVLDIDSLVVRSNITISLPGLNTITNLPTDVVRLNNVTLQIPDQYLSSNVVRLMQDGTINPAQLPSVETNRKLTMHTRDRVGIGLRNPQQKLHVHGNQVITSGRLGIGTIAPAAAFHLDDDNGAAVAFRLNAMGSTDVMQIFGSNTTPVFSINAGCNVGVRTHAPAYELHVAGTAYASTAVRTNAIQSDGGTINCSSTSLSNILTAHMTNLVVTNSMTLPAVLSATTRSEIVQTNTLQATTNSNIQVISPVRVTGFDTGLYTAHTGALGSNEFTDATRIGLRVNENILTSAVLTTSDRRLKRKIEDISDDYGLQAVLSIPVKRFAYADRLNEPKIGFMAQDVEAVVPEAVRTTSGPVPTISREVACLSPTELAISSDEAVAAEIRMGGPIKLLQGEMEWIRVVSEIQSDRLVLTEELPPMASIFCVGPIVSNLKLLDVERLVPVTFRAIQQLHAQLQAQQTQQVSQSAILENVLARVSALESRF